MKGLILIDRGVFHHVLFKREPFTEIQAWIWLISEASYKKRDVKTKKGVVHLERGQLTHSSRFLAEKWQWKEPRIRRFLKRLKNDAVIDAVNDAVQNIITICNYDTYQDFNEYKDAVNDAAIDVKSTQRRTKVNKGKIKDNIKNNNKKNFEEDFESFWEKYKSIGNAENPIGSKKNAKTKYCSLAEKRKFKPDKLIESLKCYHLQLKKEKWQKKQHATTFLNGEHWESFLEKKAVMSEFEGLTEHEKKIKLRINGFKNDGLWMDSWGAKPPSKTAERRTE